MTYLTPYNVVCEMLARGLRACSPVPDLFSAPHGAFVEYERDDGTLDRYEVVVRHDGTFAVLTDDDESTLVADVDAEGLCRLFASGFALSVVPR